jgi:hypothetical protein
LHNRDSILRVEAINKPILDFMADEQHVAGVSAHVRAEGKAEESVLPFSKLWAALTF